MDLQTRKLSFIQEFLALQNEEIISRLEELLKKHKDELYGDSPQPISDEQFKAGIDKSLIDSSRNSGLSTSELREEIKKWK